MTDFFSARQYPASITQAAHERIHNVDRTNALQPSEPKESDRIPLVLPYHPSVHPIRRILLRNFKTLMADPGTNNTFKKVPVTAYKRDRNLANHLVRATHPRPSKTSNFGTFSCERKRCNTCKYVTKDNHLVIDGPQGSFEVATHFTFVSYNVVYAHMAK
jgi:hypothetical protein